jgi:glycosyltransferase involved in cell wall biosynthesis
MIVRIICSGTEPGFDFKTHQAFIYDQVEAVKAINSDISFHYFFIRKKGIRGYLSEYMRLRAEQKNHPCDLIHAHFGLSALLAALQFKEPIVATFHGSDINKSITRIISAFAAIRASASIFVSQKLVKKAIYSGNSFVVPCGIDLSLFKPLNKIECQRALGLDSEKSYILFSSSFSNPVKNVKLLDDALMLWKGIKPEVLELWNIPREQVPVWINAADVCVLTSFSEGSPQFIKEAMACNKPIVATDVGDISERFGKAPNLRITTFEPENVRNAISDVMHQEFPNSIVWVQELDHRIIAEKIISIYKTLVKTK